MDAKHLRNDELEYELYIRHVVGVKDKQNKQKALTNMLREEEIAISVAPLDNRGCVASEEIDLCGNKLIDIKQTVVPAMKNGDNQMMDYCTSRLVHIRDRLDRISATSEEEQTDIDLLKTAVPKWLEAIEKAREGRLVRFNSRGSLASKIASMADISIGSGEGLVQGLTTCAEEQLDDSDLEENEVRDKETKTNEEESHGNGLIQVSTSGETITVSTAPKPSQGGGMGVTNLLTSTEAMVSMPSSRQPVSLPSLYKSYLNTSLHGRTDNLYDRTSHSGKSHLRNNLIVTNSVAGLRPATGYGYIHTSNCPRFGIEKALSNTHLENQTQFQKPSVVPYPHEKLDKLNVSRPPGFQSLPGYISDPSPKDTRAPYPTQQNYGSGKASQKPLIQVDCPEGASASAGGYGYGQRTDRTQPFAHNSGNPYSRAWVETQPQNKRDTKMVPQPFGKWGNHRDIGVERGWQTGEQPYSGGRNNFGRNDDDYYPSSQRRIESGNGAHQSQGYAMGYNPQNENPILQYNQFRQTNVLFDNLQTDNRYNHNYGESRENPAYQGSNFTQYREPQRQGYYDDQNRERGMPTTSARHSYDNNDLRRFEGNGNTFHNYPNTRAVSRERQKVNPNKKYKPVHAWAIKFSGETGISLMDFLDQVEMLAIAEGIGSEELLSSIIHLLNGRAFDWYRSNYREFHTWEEFKMLIREEFIPENYEQLLLWEIETRVQAKNEPFGSYLSAMKRLFYCLQTPISEGYKLYVVRKGLNSAYAMNLASSEIRSLEELSRLCKRIDNTRLMLERQKCVNINRDSLLEPDMSFPSRFNRKQVNAFEGFEDCVDNEDEVNAFQNRPGRNQKKNAGNQVEGSGNSKVTCWNCQNEGHIFNNCPNPRKGIFCYKCGTKNVVIKDCSTCKPQAADKGKEENSDRTGSSPENREENLA